MKHSKYNYIAQENNYFIIFNGLSGACIILTDTEFAHFKNFSFSNEEKNEYVRLGLIVEGEFDEIDKVLYLSRKFDTDKKEIGYRILTTTKCNAKCYYCYESDYTKFDMSLETADIASKYILDTIHNKKSLHIQWFGGEPLCNIKVIERISKKLIDNILAKGISYQSSIVTNGFLFNDRLIREAYDIWNLRSAQITLDGTKLQYERIKRFNTDNAFEKVIKNIHLLLSNGIEVKIRINYSEINKNDIGKLIAFLGKEFSHYKNIRVYAFRLFNDVKNTNTDIEILKLLTENGFNQDLIRGINPVKIACMARSMTGATIFPNGQIAKCCRGFKLPNGIIGSIFEKNFNENIYSWCTSRLKQECYDCKYLPICNGGCFFERFINNAACTINDEKINFILLTTLRQYLAKGLI